MALRVRSHRRWLAASLAGVAVASVLLGAFAAPRLQSAPPSEPPPIAAGTRPDLIVLLARGVDKAGSVVGLPGGGGPSRDLGTTGFDPAFAVTSSGDRIFVASGLDQDGVLRTIDALTGEEIRSVPFTDRWRNTLPAYFDVLTVSSDDRWLYALSFQAVGAERDGYYFRVFDIDRGQFLPEVIPLSDCVGGLALPGPTDLEIACPHSGVLLTTSIGASADVGVIASTDVSNLGIAGAARLPGSGGTLVLTSEGKVVRVDGEGVNLLFETDGALPPTFDGLAVSPDGQTVYIARGSTGGGVIASIKAFDMAGNDLASSSLADPAWTMTISKDGRHLVLPAHEADAVMILDAKTLQEVDRLDVAGGPVQVIAP